MKKYILTTCAILLASTASYAEDLNDQYPMTKEEREAKEMGSVIGGEGLVLRPNANRTETLVPAEGKINKLLWQAAQEMVDVAPLALVDAKNGVLSTDWYSTKEAPETSLRLSVRIMGSKLAAESVNVKLQQKTMKDGRWIEEETKSKFASDMATRIFARAKDLSSKK